MKKLLLAWAYFASTMCSPAHAADRVVDGASFPGISYQKSFVINPEFEKNKLNITDTSTIATRNTTTPLQGVADLSIDASASG